MGIVRIPLSSRKYQDLFAIVDEEDAERVLARHWNVDMQVRRGLPEYRPYTGFYDTGKTVKVRIHRFITDAPKGALVDHRDGDTLNNRRSNLRVCTTGQNARNARAFVGTTSQFKGVYWEKHVAKWAAVICLDNKRNRLGLFADEVEAARVYDEAARRIHGEYARLNFPLPGEQQA